MAKFTMYSSNDVGAGAPGPLTGAAGTLIALLDACLVTGYTGKAAPSPAWTHPVPTAGNIASYHQPAGAGLGLVINDNGPNVTSTFEEAWATGWEAVAGVGAPVGSGTGQFPTAAQLLTSGHTVIRKSKTADGTGRAWVLFADSSTFYLFVQTGDTAGMYVSFGFGDFYSLNNSADAYRCLIIGRSLENSVTAASEGMDLTSGISSAVVGSFIARSFGGGGSSVLAGKHGDTAKANGSTTFLGTMAAPNGVDSSYYLSPVWITESAAIVVRGRLRGFYHLLHPIATGALADGATFVGSGSYTGKTFYVVNKSTNSGMYCIETSNTLETN